jgi:hypothetical protein
MKKVFVLCCCVQRFHVEFISKCSVVNSIYDFRDQFNATVTSFEGLDFTIWHVMDYQPPIIKRPNHRGEP